jgi:tRNA(fMet)-specific endonuclease VapC
MFRPNALPGNLDLQAESEIDSMAIDAAAAHAFGQVAAALRAADRKQPAHGRAHDVMIAAVVTANDRPLVTGNPRDLDHIEGLDQKAVPRHDS